MNISLEERFWRHVDRRGDSECWEWKASTYSDGYGHFQLMPGELEVDRKCLRGAHRIAFRLIHGHWPHPMALHGCDNPLCCNAIRTDLHIHEGTRSQNALEMYARGFGEAARAAARARSGEKHASAKLTWAKVAEIRSRHATGETCAALAREFGVTHGPITALLQGRTWRRP